MVQRLAVNKEDPLRRVLNKMVDKEETPAERVLRQIQFRLQNSRDRRELQIIKGLLLAAGITAVTNSTNRDFVIRK